MTVLLAYLLGVVIASIIAYKIMILDNVFLGFIDYMMLGLFAMLSWIFVLIVMISSILSLIGFIIYRIGEYIIDWWLLKWN